MVGLNQNELQGVIISDTFSVNTSTLLLDSLPTAGKGVLLAGTLSDPDLGIITAASYFQISPSDLSSITLPDDAKFDSIRLKLQYSGYYYGDTTVKQTLSAHQLTDRIVIETKPGYLEPEEQNVFSSTATFYNKSKVNYNTTALTSKTFSPRPASGDSVMMALPVSLGKELFSMIQKNDTKISNTEEFLDYFNGIVLKADGNSVIGYKDTAEVKIYYSYTGTNGLKISNELKFSLYDNTYQFNSITADRSNTALKNISLQNRQIASAITGNKTYIQGGIGLVTKLEFPTISSIVGDKNISINKAVLNIESTKASDKPYKLPTELILLVANQRNTPQSTLTDAAAGTSSIYLRNTDDGIAKASYNYPVTDYINNYVKSYTNTSLLLSLPIADLQKTLTRLELGSQNNSSTKIKLIITYTKLL